MGSALCGGLLPVAVPLPLAPRTSLRSRVATEATFWLFRQQTLHHVQVVGLGQTGEDKTYRKPNYCLYSILYYVASKPALVKWCTKPPKCLNLQVIFRQVKGLFGLILGYSLPLPRVLLHNVVPDFWEL